jgi:hypothetical protein
MLIAAASLAVAFAIPSAAGIVPASSVPPVLVNVVAAPDVPTRLVHDVLAEADAVWGGTGLRFLWQPIDRDPGGGLSRIASARRFGPPVLRVTIGHETHRAKDFRVPLGWIVFEDATTPAQEIYVSYNNAVALLERSAGIVGAIESMPLLKRELMLARAMGRALAHELGHYLSASKVHTSKGLMMAVHSAAEFFSPDRQRFTLEAAERQRIVARMTSIYMAS